MGPYRFISTARDVKIIFWTFSPDDFEQPKQSEERIHQKELDIKNLPRIEIKNSNSVLNHPISAVLRTKHFFITSDTAILSVWRRNDDDLIKKATDRFNQ